jgi:hypothetical protein
MLVERDALQVANARIGQEVKVRTPGGVERTLRVSGTVADVGQAQARMEQVVYGYVTLATLAELGEEPYLDQLKLLVAGDRMDEAHVRGVVEDVRRFVEARGGSVRRVDVPKPGQHPHADLMGLLLLLMASFGFFALALSGVLVVNLLTALVASQVRQIGVMKAIGGSDGRIAGLYLAQALVLGGAAFVVAMPVGLWGGRALSRYLSVFLNFDIASFAVPAWVFVLSALVGLVVPVLAAARPVLRGVAVSVREALADHEVRSPGFGVSAFDRALAGVRGSSGRCCSRSGTASGGGRGSSSRSRRSPPPASPSCRRSTCRRRSSGTIDACSPARKSDLSVTLAQMVPLAQVERAIRRTPGVKGYEGWIVTEASPGAGGDAGHDSPESQPRSPTPRGRGRAARGRSRPRPLHGRRAAGRLEDARARDREGPLAAPGDTKALVANDRLAARLAGFEPAPRSRWRWGPRRCRGRWSASRGSRSRPASPTCRSPSSSRTGTGARPTACAWRSTTRLPPRCPRQGAARRQPRRLWRAGAREQQPLRRPPRLRRAHADDLRVPARDVADPRRGRRPRADDDHEPQRARAPSRDGRAARDRRLAVPGVADRGRGGRRDRAHQRIARGTSGAGR